MYRSFSLKYWFSWEVEVVDFRWALSDWLIAKLTLSQNVVFIINRINNTNNLTAFYNQLCFARTELRSLRKDKQIKLINKYIPIKNVLQKSTGTCRYTTETGGNKNTNLF